MGTNLQEMKENSCHIKRPHRCFQLSGWLDHDSGCSEVQLCWELHEVTKLHVEITVIKNSSFGIKVTFETLCAQRGVIAYTARNTDAWRAFSACAASEQFALARIWCIYCPNWIYQIYLTCLYSLWNTMCVCVLLNKTYVIFVTDPQYMRRRKLKYYKRGK